MTKTKFLNDKPDINDKASIFRGKQKGDTDVIFKDSSTGEVIFVAHNRVVIAGSQFTAMKHFNMPELVALPTYNEDLELDQSKSHGTTPDNIPKICLFCCGTDGCGTENSQVYPVKYTGRIDPVNGLVPFQYRLAHNDLNVTERKKYFGRKTLSDRIAYYFKAFESDPQMVARFVDGTLIDKNVYASLNNSDAEFYVELNLSITKEDFRDFFRATTGINSARINSVSLLTGWYSEVDGFKWYQDVIPMTRLNIPNEALIDLTKGIDIIYHVYY